MESADRATVPGSERRLDPGHRRVGDVEGAQQIEVTVYVRSRASLQWVDEEAARLPAERRVVSRDEWAREHGAHDDDLGAVVEFARRYGIDLVSVDAARRAVRLRGTVDAVARAFEAGDLGLFELPSGVRYRGREGSLSVPAELGGVVTGVFGIDSRPQAEPRIRFASNAVTTYTPVEVARAYSFPPGATGEGETVGIIELGGGYQTADLTTYFQGLGLTPPTVTTVGVDGGTNAPGVDTNADGEVMLDIEVIGSIAPRASIVVYFAPNTDQGFLDAVSTAVHDATNKPSVVSISWGGPEDSWTAQARTQMEQSLTAAGGLGATVTAAAGDGGSSDGVNDGRQHVDFPASAPHALACGGTTLQAANGQISGESVWNDSEGATGGGVSIEFAPPTYQAQAGVPANVDTQNPGRGVPDVAGDADPQTGYTIRVDGVDQTIGGTSAVAPLWAGLIALLNESLGSPLGFAQPRLYASARAPGFRDITSGNNGAYNAGAGWDACTGLGSPDGAALLAALQGGASTA
jgi:kumamolisin